MTNEEKAKNISEKNGKLKMYLHGIELDGVFFDALPECYDSAMEMAKWKDEEFAKERHELIQKANNAVNKTNEIVAELVRDRIRTDIEQWLTEHGLEWELKDILDLI